MMSNYFKVLSDKPKTKPQKTQKSTKLQQTKKLPNEPQKCSKPRPKNLPNIKEEETAEFDTSRKASSKSDNEAKFDVEVSALPTKYANQKFKLTQKLNENLSRTIVKSALEIIPVDVNYNFLTCKYLLSFRSKNVGEDFIEDIKGKKIKISDIFGKEFGSFDPEINFKVSGVKIEAKEFKAVGLGFPRISNDQGDIDSDLLLEILNKKFKLNLMAEYVSIKAVFKNTYALFGTYFFSFKTEEEKNKFMDAAMKFQDKITEKRKDKNLKLGDVFDDHSSAYYQHQKIAIKNARGKDFAAILKECKSLEYEEAIDYVAIKDEKIFIVRGFEELEITSLNQLRRLFPRSRKIA